MVYCIAENIISPLGATTSQNLEAVLQGRSALKIHQHWDMPEPFMGSLFEDGTFEYKSFENAIITSISAALSQIPSLDVTSSRVALVLSSTKGNTTITTNAEGIKTIGKTFSQSAENIAQAIGLKTKPITVSNACISGLSAQIQAMRMIECGLYDTVIVSGCDIQSKFIVSGFQSFMALSIKQCRPFDEDRNGLNLGEAVATIVYCNENVAMDKDLQKSLQLKDNKIWALCKGSIRNDAFHISGPSRTAEGSYRALRQIMEGEDKSKIACINAHGTATLYNDDMESRAIGRAEMLDIPTNSLKGYFGHTMGAAGILETILTMRSIADGTVIGTKGYNACGTICELKMTSSHRSTDKTQFIKLMSGFGGCNAAALFKLVDVEISAQ